MTHTKTPWKLELTDKWPFGLAIKSGDEIIISQNSIALSSSDKTREECESAINWSLDRRDAIRKAIAEQKANFDFIVRAVNAHDGLVAALEGLRSSHRRNCWCHSFVSRTAAEEDHGTPCQAARAALGGAK